MRLSSPARFATRAFTLVEVILASGLSVLIFGAVASLMLFGSKSTALMGNYVDLDRYSQNAFDTMTTDFRQANNVISCSSNSLQIMAVSLTNGAASALTYTYIPTNQTMTRTYEGTTTTLLKGIVSNSVSFTMYQRNPIGGDVTTNYITTNPASCKVLQVSWICARSVIGVGQTESAQTAKVVIRKE